MQRRTPRRWAQATVIASVLSAGFLSGCGGDDDATPQAVDESTSELAAHDGEPCPAQLPKSENGFGTDQPATSAPTLPAIESAWVCRYTPAAADPGPEGSGNPYNWVLDPAAHPVDAALIPDLERALSQLAPQEPDLACAADLGPRWMLAYSNGGDLTGVVADDFGCHRVQLTDEPFEIVPGEPTGSGLVPGLLSAPEGLLDLIKSAGA